MSSKYKVHQHSTPHFVTFTVVGWIDVFSREYYKEILINSLNFCIEHKGLKLHAWVIMTNHLHLIISSETTKLDCIVRDLKKFTSRQIIKAIQNNRQESRRKWMLNIFAYVGKQNKKNQDFQFWKQDYHPISLSSDSRLNQRLYYLHHNPVRGGLVWEPWHYKHSSAIDYYTRERGLIRIELLI